MAITKILPVRGQLKGCLDYAANPQKTEYLNTADMQRLMNYTPNGDKTEHQLYVSGFNCDPQTPIILCRQQSGVGASRWTAAMWATILFRASSPARQHPIRYTKSAANSPGGFWLTVLSAPSVPIWTRDICTTILS